MGQAKVRGTFDERQKEGMIKKEIHAWWINRYVDREYENAKRIVKEKGMRFSLSKSEFVDRMKV